MGEPLDDEPGRSKTRPATVWSATLVGVDGHPVRVEVDARLNAMPHFQTVGLPDGAVREGRERIRPAIRNSGFRLPDGHVTVNLAPAGLRKDGTALDLPIAIGILAALGEVPREPLATHLVLGELGLDGSLRPVRGVLCLASAARDAGLTDLLLPPDNAAEAAVVEGVAVRPTPNLRDAVEHLRGTAIIAPFDTPRSRRRRRGGAPDLRRVRGQDTAKRALEIAAAGGHNLLLVGPPGAGKTLLARCLPGVLPPMTFHESIETTRIHSVAGRLPAGADLVRDRPFRAPHHTISDAGLIGGGPHPRPGEASLAHHGVLFLDELPEFRRNVLEVLRQPLESGTVTIGRAAITLSYPARFMLVGAMNPCPCGYRNEPRRSCTCDGAQVRRYQGRVSGPLLDRIDLTVEVAGLEYDELTGPPTGPSTRDVRDRIVAARGWQETRLGDLGPNAAMDEGMLETHCALGAAAQQLLKTCMERLHLSARGHARILKVARTIADLAASETIEPEHVAEAVQFRCVEM